MKLEGQVAIITGAAGKLVFQFCKTLADQGISVWASDLDIDACDQVVSKLPNKAKHYSLVMDVAEPESVINGFAKIKSISGGPHIIINNAGVAVFDPFEERDFNDFMKVFKVNAGGTFLCIQQGSKIMKEQKIKGSIINVGSIYGVVSGDFRIYTDCNRQTSECYGASKAAIIHMTKYFAVALAGSGIRVNCISPGGIFNNQGKDFIKNYSYRVPMGRMAKETEIADLAVFLSSDKASYMTGQNVMIDGGWTIW